MAAPSSTPRPRTAARRAASGDISPARTPQGLALQVAQQATEASQIAQVEALRDIVTQTPPATLAHALESVLKGASPDAKPGSLVAVYDKNGTHFGTGCCNCFCRSACCGCSPCAHCLILRRLCRHRVRCARVGWWPRRLLGSIPCC